MTRFVLLLVPVLFGAARQPQPAPRSHVVRMVGNSFQPRDVTIDNGDTVRFILGSGGPHNAAFREIKAAAAARLRKLMRDTIADLAGPVLLDPGSTYDIVFIDVPAGKYTYWCIPHVAAGMMGTITVREGGSAGGWE